MKDEASFGAAVASAMDEQTLGERAHFSVAGALRRLETVYGVRSVTLFEHGGLQVKMYAPRGRDSQKPHSRDELYVVARGSGVFFDGTSRRRFQTGDVIFAPAGIQHRFEDFTDDFAVWVMFYGPEDDASR
ncbi:MAG TPA: cupin domain-containing protein [Blastocatellia bacterium]|jgi:mannose-6-phosphate isomerase-like protein (cupin superfamily)|nr:cupin domain-containing protein [Blastocatellia bacterium]